MPPKIFSPQNRRNPDPAPPSAALLQAIAALLPSAYNFEIVKTIGFLTRHQAITAALQLPEGLLCYATTISDLIVQFSPVETCVILADVTYGACCVDPTSAVALGADVLVHYGHSCLIPTDQAGIPTLYVFVEIQIDVKHLVQSLVKNFPPCEIVLVATVQFVAALPTVKASLEEMKPMQAILSNLPDETSLTAGTSTTTTPISVPGSKWVCSIPRAHPLSPGEILGCTSPSVPASASLIVYVGDGRFHLESVLIANPSVSAVRYDPYAKKLSTEEYDHGAMRAMRTDAVRTARTSLAKDPPKKLDLASTSSNIHAQNSTSISSSFTQPGQSDLREETMSQENLSSQSCPDSITQSNQCFEMNLKENSTSAVDSCSSNINLCCRSPTTVNQGSITPSSSCCEIQSSASAPGISACITAPPSREITSSKNVASDIASVNSSVDQWGVVVGTLGKQGSLKVLSVSIIFKFHSAYELTYLQSVNRLLQGQIAPIPILISELSPAKLALFPQLSVFVQTSCPRLSIDWGYAFGRPLLTPYECAVTVGSSQGWENGEIYPMDFYADNSRGDWTPRHGMGIRPKRQVRAALLK